MITIELKLFAMLREWVGRDYLELKIPEALPVGQVPDFLEIKKKLPPLRFAVNEEFVAGSHRLQEGDVVCLVPPVAGGN